MRAKRKMLFSFVALAMFVVMACVSVGFAIAALNANVNNGFTISYTASSPVKGAVAGSWNLAGTEKNMTIGGQEGLLTYNGTETDGGGILTLLAI